MPQINDIRELAQQNARYVSNSPQDWMSYLDVAARLYRYSFTDALLIHAQRPDATACAELELWNQKMSRWVNRGAKGIALLDDTGPRTKLRYVFDIADTHLVRGGRTPLLWNLDSHEHEQTILDHLADTYGLLQTDSMNTALMELAQQLTADNLDEAMDGLAYEVADTFLEELDEDNIRVRFRELMTNSIFYTLSRRCGQEPMDVLDDDDFIRIVDFNKLPVLSFLGNAVSEQCEAVLFDIGREMRKIYKKEITQQLEKSVDSLYNTNTDFNALKRETPLPPLQSSRWTRFTRFPICGFLILPIKSISLRLTRRNFLSPRAVDALADVLFVRLPIIRGGLCRYAAMITSSQRQKSS